MASTPGLKKVAGGKALLPSTGSARAAGTPRPTAPTVVAHHDPAVIVLACPARATRIAAHCTEQAPTLTGGFGGWERIARPRRVALTDWQGVEPFTMTISLRFDGWAAQQSIEPALTALLDMAVDRGSRSGPPTVYAAGSLPLRGVGWVIDSLEFGDSLWSPRRVRLRQDVTITLLERVASDLVALTPAVRAAEKAKAKTKAKTEAKGRGRETALTRVSGRALL